MDRRACVQQLLAGAGVALLGGANPFSLGKPKIKWQSDLKAAYRIAVAEQKPLLILFGAEWCTYCHKLERETLGERPMVEFVHQQFVPVHLDFDAHPRIVQVLQVESLPCTVVLSTDAELLLQHTGFAKSDKYRAILQEALDRQAEIRTASETEPAP
jgi:thioredoxin-like negative regulator of GroEL